MWNYLVKQREGQALIIGTIALAIGLIMLSMGIEGSRWAFYVAIFFLGFFATKDALVDTIANRSPNVDLLMILAALGAVVINYESEGAMLLFIFALAEFLEDYASNKSTRAIEALMAQVPQVAHLIKENGEVVEVPTDELQVDQRVLVAKGAQIPIDGVTDRKITVNEAALTGESIPVEKDAQEEVFAGTLNLNDAFQLKVTKTSDQTIFSNIIRMVEEAQGSPSRISRFIDRFESQYVVGVLIAVPLFIILLMYVNGFSFQEAFYRGMVLLTVASPCALVASATPATLSAISNGAKNGVLFKGGAAMEALSTMDILFSDKTGTLTVGDFSVVDAEIADDILKEVIYMEQQSSHPIAQGIVNSYPNIDLSTVDTSEPVEEIAGHGLRKGALMIGKPETLVQDGTENPYSDNEDVGNTLILVKQNQTIVGFFALADEVRSEAQKAVQAFQQNGVEVQLITGDNAQVAQKVADAVGIQTFHASCLPEEKIKFVQEEQVKDHVVGMIGDGINDAPALANADIGIAMGEGSSVAMESSDVVIVQNNLAKLFYSFELSKKLNHIIKQNIIFAIAVIVILIILNLLGWLDLPMGVVFHEGSTILVILNGLRLLAEKDTVNEATSEVAQTSNEG